MKSHVSYGRRGILLPFYKLSQPFYLILAGAEIYTHFIPGPMLRVQTRKKVNEKSPLPPPFLL
jgi:hypothetical protein